MAATGDSLDVVTYGGDMHLGGQDFDYNVQQWFIKVSRKFTSAMGCGVRMCQHVSTHYASDQETPVMPGPAELELAPDHCSNRKCALQCCTLYLARQGTWSPWLVGGTTIGYSCLVDTERASLPKGACAAH